MGSVVSQMIGKGLLYFLRLIDTSLVIRCVLSWFVSPYSRVMQFFVALTEPFVAPCRRLLNRMSGGRPMMFDLSMLTTMLVLIVLQRLVSVIFF